MHPAGILHFASPDIMSVLVITRKNTRETLQNQFSPCMSVLAKKKRQVKSSCHPVILLRGAQGSRFTLTAVTNVLHGPMRHAIWLEVSKDVQHGSAMLNNSNHNNSNTNK